MYGFCGQTLGFESQLGPFAALMPWLTGLPSLNLGILVCGTGVMTASTLQGCWEGYVMSYTQAWTSVRAEEGQSKSREVSFIVIYAPGALGSRLRPEAS